MSRAVTRVTTAVAIAATVVLTASPALAANPIGPAEGHDPGVGLSPAATLLLYVATPVFICLLIAAAVLLPGAVRSSRYRPAKGWGADPVWFAGPVDSDSAIANAERGDVTRGGAHGSW